MARSSHFCPSDCPYERRDLGNYKSEKTGIKHTYYMGS